MRYSKGYKGDTHPFLVRLKTIWWVLTKRNYIFASVVEYREKW